MTQPDEDDGFPGYNGVIGEIPLPNEADRRAAWKSLYIARFVEVGFDAEWGEKDFEAHAPDDIDYTQDPKTAADDSIAYYTDDDGDLA